MRNADAALLDSLSGKMVRRNLSEMVRRPGDTFTSGMSTAGLSTFTVKSGRNEDEGTAFKAKTADGKVVPIIMRGIRGQGGSAEILVPGRKRMSLTIDQASKIRQNIGMYDLDEVGALVDAVRANRRLPEHAQRARGGMHEMKDQEGMRGTSGRYKKHVRCDACCQPILGEHVTDDDVCGGSDGPGFYVCSRKRCGAKLEGKSVEERRKIYTAGRAKNKAEADREEKTWHPGGGKAPRVRSVVTLADLSKKNEGLEAIALDSLLEKSPPGWSGTVKAMKKHMPNDKAFALAWSMHKKGATPHYKAERSSNSEGEPVKKKRFQSESARLAEAMGDQDDDLEFIADPAALQKSIEQKLGLAHMRCPSDVLDVISSMYDTDDVPAAVYAAAAGMARAEQSMSAASAKVLNQLSAADVAAAIMKGVQATGTSSIKDMEKWWSTEIGKLSSDRRSLPQNTVGSGEEDDVQPYIDSLSTEEEAVDDNVDAVFDDVASGDEDSLPIGSGALSSYQVIGIESGYRVPTEMQGNEDLSRELRLDVNAAANAIRNGTSQVNNTATMDRNAPSLPGVENRIKPQQYTAESFDVLPYKVRLRLAEAYDKMMGNAPDLSHDELVDAEAYKAMITGRMTPTGKATPVADVAPLGKVEVSVDSAFEDAVSED